MDYSRMKWQDIETQTHDRGKSKHHFLKSLDSLSPEAWERIREWEEFHVVWYDPKHEFCPSRR